MVGSELERKSIQVSILDFKGIVSFKIVIWERK